MNESRVILITGTSSEIGTAFARLAIQDRNTQIIAHYRTMNDSLARLIDFGGDAIVPMQADLLDPEELRSLIAAVSEQYQAPTHLLHLTAENFSYMRLREFDSDTVKRNLDLQVFALAEMLKAFLPVMARRRFGRVAGLVSSCTLGAPPKFLAHYVIVKYAMLGLLRSAAVEYAEKGICVNGISPGMVETKFINGIDPRIVEMDAAQCPQKRHISVEEIAEFIHFLFSDSAEFINGQNLNLSGGTFM